jgi:hypothetical protein
MTYFTRELKTRNPLLYYFGWANALAALVCLLLMAFTDTQVLGINAWIKPFKFFLSTLIFAWTMGWIMAYLDKQGKVKAYSIMVILVLLFENIVISWQAANGRLSHFNISDPFYLMLFNLMGVAITILCVWTGYIAYLFFRQTTFKLPAAYVWGIRLGIVFFVIFAFEGGFMAARLSHTVGAADGGPGMPLVNWSNKYGDLRIAHFMGMHSLQVLPLAGYYIFRRPGGIITFSTIYFVATGLVLLMALKGLPLLRY